MHVYSFNAKSADVDSISLPEPQTVGWSEDHLTKVYQSIRALSDRRQFTCGELADYASLEEGCEVRRKELGPGAIRISRLPNPSACDIHDGHSGATNLLITR